MADTPGFSFVRLGDGDLILLLAWQEGRSGTLDREGPQIGGAAARQNRAISLRHAERLHRAIERASYVDFYDRIWPNSELLPRLHLSRPAGSYRNPDAETSVIIMTWLEFEFKEYCRGQRIGIMGAEAGLLQELMRDPSFHDASRQYWPVDSEIHILRPRDDGRNLDNNLDLVADDLRQWIRAKRLDTVFLSLGAAAKILCVELADELGVSFFDFGAMLRALTYSGSPGNLAFRGTHLPFLFRVPFVTWCKAMERVWPDLKPQEKLAKVHAQLILEVQEKEVGWTHASWEYDFSKENVAHFKESFREYKRRYRHLFNHSAITRKERADFLHFCGTHKLTWEGRLFMAKFHAKGIVRRCLGRSS
jgi:hypothetical protein